jgi:hypothetical protein
VNWTTDQPTPCFLSWHFFPHKGNFRVYFTTYFSIQNIDFTAQSSSYRESLLGESHFLSRPPSTCVTTHLLLCCPQCWWLLFFNKPSCTYTERETHATHSAHSFAPYIAEISSSYPTAWAEVPCRPTVFFCTPSYGCRLGVVCAVYPSILGTGIWLFSVLRGYKLCTALLTSLGNTADVGTLCRELIFPKS